MAYKQMFVHKKTSALLIILMIFVSKRNYLFLYEKFVMNIFCKNFFLSLIFIGCTIFASAQQLDTSGKTIIRAAGTEYLRSPFHQSLWGRNYRLEWATPVPFPILKLDTAFGGLAPHKEGG